jgi:flagellar assembly protein FliH
VSRNGFIPSEQLGGVALWRFGAVGPVGIPQGGIEDPEAIGRAHAAGQAEGHAAGRAEAEAEAAQRMADYLAGEGEQMAQRFAGLLQAATAQLADSEQQIARGTLEIACALARQVLRQELASRPEVLLPVVQEAVAMLLADARSASVRLAPPDFERLAPALESEFSGRSVSLRADAEIAPGDCLVESAGAVVDGGVATRWARAVAALGLRLPWDDAEPADADAHA